MSNNQQKVVAYLEKDIIELKNMAKYYSKSFNLEAEIAADSINEMNKSLNCTEKIPYIIKKQEIIAQQHKNIERTNKAILVSERSAQLHPSATHVVKLHKKGYNKDSIITTKIKYLEKIVYLTSTVSKHYSSVLAFQLSISVDHIKQSVYEDLLEPYNMIIEKNHQIIKYLLEILNIAKEIGSIYHSIALLHQQ